MNMKKWLTRGGACLGVAGVCVVAAIASPIVPKPDVSDLIHQLAQEIRDNYVFPDKGDEAATMLEQKLDQGEYNGLAGMQLAQKLTNDLQSFTHDRHFGVRPASPQAEGEHSPQPANVPTAPFGFAKVERLDGNIGYVDLRGFAPRAAAAPTVHAAMKLLQGSDALIFDLRQNGGGDPETVQLLCSYLFDPDNPVHLNSLYFRPTDETTEFWTQPDQLESDAMASTPVWVLTSNYTFSGGEEFTYNLKTRQRATIVGETTGGGAHPVDGFMLGDHQLVALIPVGRAINPVTGDDWEGKGVAPDVEAPASEALDIAISQALERMAKSEDPGKAENAAWALANIQAKRGGKAVSEDALRELAGAYGDRKFELRDGALWYARSNATAGGAWRKLICIADDTFVIEGIQDFRLEFNRDDDAKVIGVTGHYKVREPDYTKREG
ncbi:MAG: S41 family peptidase [Phycisphaerales bacterium]